LQPTITLPNNRHNYVAMYVLM